MVEPIPNGVAIHRHQLELPRREGSIILRRLAIGQQIGGLVLAYMTTGQFLPLRLFQCAEYG